MGIVFPTELSIELSKKVFTKSKKEKKALTSSHLPLLS